LRFPKAGRRTIESDSSTRAWRSVFGTFLIRRPYSTFSATVMCGKSA
jgi:hypothetical protein